MQAAHQSLTATNLEHNKQVVELSAKTKDQVAVLDKALSEELSNSLNGLGKQLAALSERFVADYGPLTDKLRALVDVSRQLK